MHGAAQASGSGFPARTALNNAIDCCGCEAGAVCEAPLMVAKDKISPYTCVHPPTWERYTRRKRDEKNNIECNISPWYFT